MTTARLHLRPSLYSYSYISKPGIVKDTQSPYPSRSRLRRLGESPTFLGCNLPLSCIKTPSRGGQGGPAVGSLASVD